MKEPTELRYRCEHNPEWDAAPFAEEFLWLDGKRYTGPVPEKRRFRTVEGGANNVNPIYETRMVRIP